MKEVRFPPFDDVLVLAKNSPQGRIGLTKAIELLSPDTFQMFAFDDENNIEAVFVSKKILQRIKWPEIHVLLKENIYPHIAEGEIMKVDFDIRFGYVDVESEIQ